MDIDNRLKEFSPQIKAQIISFVEDKHITLDEGMKTRLYDTTTHIKMTDCMPILM